MSVSIHGGSVKRVEDPRLITGKGDYLDNMRVQGELWMVPVRSQVPHGIIISIDTDEALAADGVVAVHTGSDFADMLMPIDAPGQPEETRRPLVALDRVRFVGDIVALVVAESRRAAVDAAELVWADIDMLPAIVDVESATAEDAPLLFPDLGTNRIFDAGTDPIPDLHDGSDVTVQVRVRHQRVAALPLESNGALTVPRDDGGFDVWAGSQAVHAHRNTFSNVLSVDRSTIRLRTPDMGGGFGAKIYCYPEQVLTAAVARIHARPVRWQESRTENLQAMNQGRAQIHDVEMSATRDGRIVGVRFAVTQDAGAYPLYGAYMPHFTQRMASGPYAIPKIEFRWRTHVTNTTPVHAYRGAGRPEATVSLERAIDVLAAELGMDPVEVRRRNFIPDDAFPYTTATGERYDTGRYEAALDLALRTAGVEELRSEQTRRREAGDRWQLGIGVASYVEVTAPGGRKDWGSVAVGDDGTVTVTSGASSHGHSHETTFAQMISGLLKVPIDQIRFVQADTDMVVRGGGTMGSRSMQMAGSAIVRAGSTVLDKARAIVAHESEAAFEDVIQFDDGQIGVAGVPDSALTLAEVASIADDPTRLPEGMEPGLSADDTWVQEQATVPFGTHVSVVEVDTETGDVRLLRHIACDDCGTIFSRMVVDGQVHGGVAQGIGQALFEEVRFDADGNPLSGNLTTYLPPTAATVPDIEIDHTETPTTENVLGAKGIGEAGTIGSTPAVVNAVHDALRPLGVAHLDMPLTPAKIWSALQANRERRA